MTNVPPGCSDTPIVCAPRSELACRSLLDDDVQRAATLAAERLGQEVFTAEFTRGRARRPGR